MRMPARRRRQQQGLALLVMVIVLMLGSAFIVTRQLSSAGLRLESAATSNKALAQAREALIGWSATNSSRPGALPCPDRYPPGNANEGVEGSIANGATCPGAGDRIGRLPWKTLGLPDLRDASGERLWYALSSNFRNSGVVNSETLGTLVITGAAPGTGIVAIVFAPGAALSGQNRDPGNSANLTSVANYLDGENGDVANNETFITAQSSDTFNDTLLAITHADLFSVVENYVATRLNDNAIGNVKPFINSYVSAWGAYPFAVPFTSSPSTAIDSYVGTANTTFGWLPITKDASILTWRIPASSEQLVQQTGHVGTATGKVTSDCSSTTSATFTCVITSQKTGGSGSFQPSISVTPTLKNVGMAFLDYDLTTVGSGDIDFKTTSGASVSYGTSSSTYARPSWSANSLRPDGGADMAFTNGRLRSTSGSRSVVLKITWSGSPNPFLVRPTSPSSPNIDWFFNNQWYRLTYYAMSTGYAPGQGKSCVAGGSPLCLSVNNLSAPNNDKGAILVLAGRAGTGQTRPSSLLVDYFEGQNASPADRVFESNTRSNAFNDKIVVLAP